MQKDVSVISQDCAAGAVIKGFARCSRQICHLISSILNLNLTKLILSIMADEKELNEHGFTPATVRDHESLAEIKNAAPARPTTTAELPVPSTPLAQAVTKYAQEKLQEQTFNHSMRVFYFGQAIRKQYFSQWTFSDETWLLSCLLHDIGTTDENLHATLMSFEFYGGIVALNELERQGSSQAQRESVAEAIFRHQDLGKTGTITALGQLLQLATVFGKNVPP